MTTFWLAAGALTLGVVAIMIVPFLRFAGFRRERADYDVSVYTDQLKEVDRDVDRGLMTEAEAEQARVEIKRRMLTAAGKDEIEDAHHHVQAKTGRRVLAGAMAVLIAGGSVAVYMTVGAPGEPDQPIMKRRADALGLDQATAEKLLAQVDDLAAQTRETPDDPQAWIRLGQAYDETNQPGQAAKAYRQALRQGAEDTETLLAYGMALLGANQGMVVPQARKAFETVIRRDPANPQALAYLGLAQAQAGDGETAISILKYLLETSGGTTNTGWRAQIRTLIERVAGDSGLDPHAIAAAPPTLDDGATASAPGQPGFSPDQMAMIQGMVGQLEEKLAANPDDFQGWMRLGRSYTVLGDLDKAVAAYEGATTADPEDVEAQLLLAKTAAQAVNAGGEQGWPERTVRALDAALSLDPTNTEALYMRGLIASQQGDAPLARDHWTALLDVLGPDHPDRAQLQGLIDGL